MKTMKEVEKVVEDVADKQRRNNDDEELIINPAGACGLVDSLLHALVAQNPENADFSILEEICYGLIKRARAGDIDACRLIFDRISGAPVTFVVGMGEEEDAPTEIGIS